VLDVISKLCNLMGDNIYHSEETFLKNGADLLLPPHRDDPSRSRSLLTFRLDVSPAPRAITSGVVES
jgi:hypothetical protein